MDILSHVDDDPRRSRHHHIVEQLERTGQVEVTELSCRLGVSGMTIRRDLAALDRAGRLRRVHGGAVIRSAPALRQRAAVRTREKQLIAHRVAEIVEPGTLIGLDTGTTCHAVARELGRRGDLTVVTNSLHAAIAARGGGNRTIVLGGGLTPELSTVDDGSSWQPPLVHLDMLVLGCGGLSVDRGATYFDPQEVAVRAALIACADRVVVATDHSKLQAEQAMQLGPLSLVDVLVTNRLPPEPLLGALIASEVDVVLSVDESAPTPVGTLRI